MAIPVSMVAQVVPGILTPGAAGLEFNGLLLTKNVATIPTNDATPGLMSFTSARSVGQYFGTTSDEYEFASRYFRGFNNSTRKPRALFIAAFYETAQTAWIRGTSVRGKLSAFRALTAAEFTVNFSGTDVTITPISLTAATSYSEIASLLQAAIRAAGTAPEATAATVTFSSIFNAFTITSGAAGAAGVTVSVADGNLASLMGMQADQTPTISNGIDSQTLEQTMEMAYTTTGNFISFTTLWQAETGEMNTLAHWCDEQYVRFVYVVWDTDANLKIMFNTDNNATILAANGYNGTFFMYGTFEYAAFVMGAIASVNYRTRQGAITFAFKSQAGLAFNINTEEEANALRDKHVSFYGNYASANDSFIFLYDTSMLSGDWQFLDTYTNAVWLNNELQLAEIRTLTLTNRIPYNDPGYTKIRRALNQVAAGSAGKNGNGIIDTGVTLDNLQLAEIESSVGFDVSQDLYNYGYYLFVRDPEPGVRATRGTPDIGLFYVYGGSVHELIMGSTAVT